MHIYNPGGSMITTQTTLMVECCILNSVYFRVNQAFIGNLSQICLLLFWQWQYILKINPTIPFIDFIFKTLDNEN